MVDAAPQFEVTDELGSTLNFVSGVGTVATSFPVISGGRISLFLIKCPRQTPVTKYLEFSVDGGVSWNRIGVGEAIGYPLRGAITQIQVKGSVNTVNMELWLSQELP